jgi:hypothetical protein
VFGPLNKAFNNVCSEFLAENALHSVNKWSFPGLLSSSWDIAFTKSNIQSGFRACGIYPFNPRAVDQGMLLPSKPSDSALVPSTENESPLTPVASAPTSNDDVAIAAAGLALLSSSCRSSGSSITGGEDAVDVNTPGVAVHCSIGRAAIDGDGGTLATRELDDDELLDRL